MWYAESLKRDKCNWSLHLKVVSDSDEKQMWRYAYNFQYTPSLRMLLARTHQVTRKTDFRLEYKDSDGHHFPLDSDESLNEALAVTNLLDGNGENLLHFKLNARMKFNSEVNSNPLPSKCTTDADALKG
ncbi:hypothetical protein WR25_18923 [Diploscapter pachys]|uniref:PB1 domain-containing protein n=1 Tax=Diploscapter pachys TaxID=2018661 RepID=A0A2A2KHL0_9BILA|nr:hypothetical protein WR25_18923 [Diploscapter pachys]